MCFGRPGAGLLPFYTPAPKILKNCIDNLLFRLYFRRISQPMTTKSFFILSGQNSIQTKEYMKKPSKKKELMDRLIKEEVVNTVLELIQEDDAITMDAVALRCGVAKGTLYNYFNNKKDLLTYVHNQVILPIKTNCSTLFDAAISPEEKINTFVDRVFAFQQSYPLYFRFIQSQRSAAEALEERMTLTILPLVKVCEAGIAEKKFINVDPYVMAAMVFGTVIGTMESLAHRSEPVQNIENLKKDVHCLLDRLILKEKDK